jgi:hypothetical protein
MLMMFKSWDETTSLNCCQQRAYCSSLRWCMGMESYGEMIWTGENSWFIHQTSLAILPAESFSSKAGGTWRKKCWILPTKHFFHTSKGQINHFLPHSVTTGTVADYENAEEAEAMYLENGGPGDAGCATKTSAIWSISCYQSNFINTYYNCDWCIITFNERYRHCAVILHG